MNPPEFGLFLQNLTQKARDAKDIGEFLKIKENEIRHRLKDVSVVDIENILQYSCLRRHVTCVIERILQEKKRQQNISDDDEMID